jgi:hypothetical protein
MYHDIGSMMSVSALTKLRKMTKEIMDNFYASCVDSSSEPTSCPLRESTAGYRDE